METVLTQGLVTNKHCTYCNIKKYVVVNFSNKTKKYLIEKSELILVNFSNKTKKYLIAKSEIILVNYYNKTKKSDRKIRTYTCKF